MAGMRLKNVITTEKGFPLTPDEYYKLQAEFLQDIYIAEHLGVTREHFERYKAKFCLLNLKKEDNPYLLEKILDLANEGISFCRVAVMLKMDRRTLRRILEVNEMDDIHFGAGYYIPYTPIDYYQLKREGLTDGEIVDKWGITKSALYTWKRRNGVKIGSVCRIMKKEQWDDLYQKEIAKTRKACS